MPRFTDLPTTFCCPHRHGCPYLEGLPAAWVWARHQRAVGLEGQYEQQLQAQDREIAELKKQLTQTEQERDESRAQCQALQRRQFKAKRKKPTPAPGAEPTGQTKKKRGAPKGHPAWQRRPPEQIDQSIAVGAPARCPHCQNQNLQPVAELHQHVQEDIVLVPRTVTTAYVHQQAYCPGCERLVHQLGPNELAGSYIGPVAKATATYLRQELRISYRNVQRIFDDLFGLKFVPASAYGFDRQAARRGHPLYADLRDKVRSLQVVHADETSWRHEGNNYWVWFAGNQDLAAFLWQAHRSTEAAQELLGEDLSDAILVADAYGSYNGLKVKDRQSCLAHIKRTAKELAQELALLQGKAQDREALQMCQAVQAWVKALCLEAHQPGPWRARQQQKKERAYRQRLQRLCKKPLRHERTETFRQRLLGKQQAQLLTCLRHPQVPPTNNLAEQSLRPVVIMRKVIQGTRSEQGLENHSVLRSLFETARRQGKKVRQFFESLFTTDTATAQAALYQNSS
jgi:transposase